MKQKIVAGIMVLLVPVVFSGCATGRKQSDLEMQGLKNQIAVLEAQLQSKDEELAAFKEGANKTEYAGLTYESAADSEPSVRTKKVIGEAKSRPTMRQIQTALKNAGYNPGPIDGKKGKQTKEAIKSFQRDHNLGIDGIAGKRTWEALSEHLYKN